MSGCGKSTIGAALAKRLGDVPFLDGDDLHPQSNVEKMSNGTPLTDEDRAPWLARIRATALTITGNANTSEPDGAKSENDGAKSKIVVIGCSALKRHYRDVLRGVEDHPQVDTNREEHEGLDPSEDRDSKPLAPHANLLKTYFVFIDGSREVLVQRMMARKGHFMKEKMLDSQLATLESPSGEPDVVTVDLEGYVDTKVESAVEGLQELGLQVPLLAKAGHTRS